jgi:tripartite-type tricarboxylate transporter receptor subunit TctC
MKKLLLSLAALAFTVSAQAEYPSSPIRIVLPYAPGGGADIVGRPLSVEMAKILKTSVFVENRGGASGNIAMDHVARSAPDGYTLVLPLTAQVSVNQNLFKKLSYDPLKDFAPIMLIGKSPYFLVVNPSVPAQNLQQFIALAKKDPGKYSYASTGSGSGLHLSMELLKSTAGIDIVHIPYKGAGEGQADLLAGRVEAMFASAGAAKGFIQSGKMRALGATTLERSAALPDVPTIAEQGLPGYESYVWYALLAPKGTPAPIIKKLHDAAVQALNTPEVQKQFAAAGIESIGSTPEELARFEQSESVKWQAVMKKAGVVPE